MNSVDLLELKKNLWSYHNRRYLIREIKRSMNNKYPNLFCTNCCFTSPIKELDFNKVIKVIVKR